LLSPNGCDGFEYHDRLLREYTSYYKGTLFIGASMGGSAVLLFSHLCDHAVAFDPLIDLRKDPRWNFYIPSLFIKKEHLDFIVKKIDTSIAEHQLKQHFRRGGIAEPTLIIHVSDSQGDRLQASMLPNSNYKMIKQYNKDQSRNHGVARYLKSCGKLIPELLGEYNTVKKFITNYPKKN